MIITQMDIKGILQLIYDYISRYPVLVSTLCKYMDEHDAWSKDGLVNANKALLIEKNSYNPDDTAIDIAFMYGFVKNQNGAVVVASRIFEVRIYNWFISLETTDSPIFSAGLNDKNQFV